MSNVISTFVGYLMLKPFLSKNSNGTVELTAGGEGGLKSVDYPYIATFVRNGLKDFSFLYLIEPREKSL